MERSPLAAPSLDQLYSPQFVRIDELEATLWMLLLFYAICRFDGSSIDYPAASWDSVHCLSDLHAHYV